MYVASATRPVIAEPPAPLLPVFMFSTGKLPQRLQYAAWQEHGGTLADIEPLPPSRGGFVMEQTGWDLGGLALTKTTFPPIGFARTARQVRGDGLDHWFLSALRRGRARSTGADRVAELTPGAVHVQSLKSEFRGRADALEVVHLFIPRDFCRDEVAVLDAAENTVIDTGLGRLLADYLLNLEARLHLMSEADLPGLLTSMRALVLACLTPRPEALFDARHAIHATLLERARQLVQSRLFAPSLGADELCLELGVSRSQLYRMFEAEGGVVRYIRKRRLLDAHAALANAGDHRTIVEIAAERGFMDAAEFSRAFKREFGYRPTDVRSQTRIWPLHHARHGEGEDGLVDLLAALN